MLEDSIHNNVLPYQLKKFLHLFECFRSFFNTKLDKVTSKIQQNLRSPNNIF